MNPPLKREESTQPTATHAELTDVEGTTEVSVYTDGSKTEHHVGAGKVAVKNSREKHNGTQKLNIECTVFQAELRGIGMAVDWILNQRKKTASNAINVDSKAALLAIVNKHSTHPLAVDTRRKIIELRTTTLITFHWIKGHTGLKGNESADYLAKTVASYNPTTTYDSLPVSKGKQLLEDYYTKIWNATYVNFEKTSHTKPLIPSIFHRMSLPLWPNYTLTQLLTNHGCLIKFKRRPHHSVPALRRPN